MSLDSQPENSPSQNRKRISFRQMRDFVMGLIYLAASALAIYAEKSEAIHFGMNFVYFFAGLLVLYGVFRIYRSFKA